MTSKIPLFHGIGSFHINAADLLLLVLLVIAVAKRSTGEARPWPRTPLAKSMYVVFGFVMLGVLIGKMHGGQLRYAFTETRPFAYLLATFVLSYALLTTRWALRAVFWALVATEAFKSVQGILLFSEVRHYAIRPDAVLGHEEGVFFGLFMLLTMALWIFDVPMGRLRKTATWITPLVVAADLANTRRAAWLVLAGGLITLLAVAYRVLPHRRALVGKIAGAIAIGLMVYLPAYWNKSGGLAQPARAIHSVVKPSTATRPPTSTASRRTRTCAQHPRGQAARPRIRRSDRLRAADPGHQLHRPADQVHPAQRDPLRPHADGRPGRDRVLEHDRHRDHRRLPPGAIVRTGSSQ